jgi:hypothetical protein
MPNKLELPRNKWEKKNRVFVCLGDKVVCNTNSYDLRDYSERYSEYDPDGIGIRHTFIPCPETKQMLNGEVGIIVGIDPLGVLEIDFGDRVVELPASINDYNNKRSYFYQFDPRKAIELAYAYIMASCAFFNLSRPNFYTGLTRAMKHATILTDQRSFATSLRSMGWKPKGKK